MTKQLKWAIAILMTATVFRAQTVLFLSSVETFGGPAPDAWFGPWLSDSVLGFLVPAMVYLFWTGRGVQVWGVLVVYNALGVFDYGQGLLTQVFHPMPATMASPLTVYVGIGLFMIFQFIALGLLFRREVADYFCDEVAPA